MKVPIFTFVNDNRLYAEMRESFERAGFVSQVATYERLSGSDCDEPYSTLTKFIESVEEPFFVLCHQDVRLDQGDGYSRLLEVLAELSRVDPDWAVAGNAGGSAELRMIRRISDPHGLSTPDRLPAVVESLDENLLIIRSGTGLTCTPSLHGFHLYGTELCLQARTRGLASYVIDFHLRHLSAGTIDVGYEECRDRLLEVWGPRFHAHYVRSSMEVLFFSRWSVLRATLGSTRVRRVIKNRPWLGRLVGRVLA
jgi:hypothetical protein